MSTAQNPSGSTPATIAGRYAAPLLHPELEGCRIRVLSLHSGHGVHGAIWCGGRSGQLCTRYVRADLPLLNLSSKAGLDSVLGIGIALIVIALLLMCLMAALLLRMRRKQRRRRKCGRLERTPPHSPHSPVENLNTAAVVKLPGLF